MFVILYSNSTPLKKDFYILMNYDTHRETVFYSVQYKNNWFAASDLFDMFTQSIKFYYTLYYHVLRVQMFVKM